MNPPLVKVCCISTIEEAHIALGAGADLLGFVSEMPSGPGVISLRRITRIIKQLPRNTKSVLLTSKLSAQEIIKQHQLTKSWGIQLVDKVPFSELKILRLALPQTELIQVVHILDTSSVAEALSYSKMVNALLLDSGQPLARKKTLGGTGNTHDWSLSRAICEQSDLPVFLAGGINPENARDALHEVKPNGVDLCSGLRSDGHLDPAKVNKFFTQVRLG